MAQLMPETLALTTRANECKVCPEGGATGGGHQII